jgi:hypothetical protein
MENNSILDQAKFWEIVTFLVELNQEMSFQALSSELNVSKKQLNSFIHFLEGVNCRFSTKGEGDSRVLIPNLENHKIVFEFTLVEWLQFQAHFPCLDSVSEAPYHQRLKSKLASIEHAYQGHDLFSPLEVLDNLYSNELSLVSESPKDKANFFVGLIEEAILDKKSVLVKIKNQEDKIKIYPRKIVFFDGDFNLIGEGISDGCLSNLALTEVEKVDLESASWDPVFSRRELDDFVISLRFMAENTTRLVLKVYSQDKFHVDLDYQFIEKPCMFSNPSGEHIWAATIEPNEKIFEWLYELGPCVEILDPRDFKVEFFNYCENKLKKLA